MQGLGFCMEFGISLPMAWVRRKSKVVLAVKKEYTVGA